MFCFLRGCSVFFLAYLLMGSMSWATTAAYSQPAIIKQRVATKTLPTFHDDSSPDSLQHGLTQSLAYVATRARLKKKLRFGGGWIPAAELHRSLLFFQRLVAQKLPGHIFNRQIRRYFDWYRLGEKTGHKTLGRVKVTGYYQPVFEGASTQRPGFSHPIYTIPSDLVVERDGTGRPGRVGRFENNQLVDYWTRGEIETGARAKGAELVWLRDPIESFSLHIQGSGLIRVDGGALRGLHYAVGNGRQYRSIGRYMIETGRLKPANAGFSSIRRYLERYPEEQADILHHNDSFIFFNWTETLEATGSLGKGLTPGRSIAADHRYYPSGALCVLTARKPEVSQGRVQRWSQLARFVFVQDAGSAIKGPGRVDLFWGAGKAAGLAASCMKERGVLSVLLLKKAYAHASP